MDTTKTTWIEEGELDVDFGEMKARAYEELGLEAETDDSTDEAINDVLDVRGIRKLFTDGYRFDSDATADEIYDAVKSGMQVWAKDSTDIAHLNYAEIEAGLIAAGATEQEADALMDILHEEGWGGAEHTDLTPEVLGSKLEWYRTVRV